jgi:hypothetical protein
MEFVKWFNLFCVAINCVTIFYLKSDIEPLLVFISVLNAGVFIDLSVNQ